MKGAHGQAIPEDPTRPGTGASHHTAVSVTHTRPHAPTRIPENPDGPTTRRGRRRPRELSLPVFIGDLKCRAFQPRKRESTPGRNNLQGRGPCFPAPATSQPPHLESKRRKPCESSGRRPGCRDHTPRWRIPEHGSGLPPDGARGNPSGMAPGPCSPTAPPPRHTTSPASGPQTAAGTDWLHRERCALSRQGEQEQSFLSRSVGLFCQKEHRPQGPPRR